MPTIYIVRHGHVASGAPDDENPQLSERGQTQALAVAEELNRRLPGRIPILTSPMQRCRQTAAPLCELWGAEACVEPRVAEVPGPPREAMPRAEWIRASLVADWPQFIQLGSTLRTGFDATLTSWRAGVLQAVLACTTDTLIFSHFVPINVLTGHSLRSERVACFLPDHASISVFQTSAGSIRLIERGREKP